MTRYAAVTMSPAAPVKKRTQMAWRNRPFRQFLRDVRQELRKVDWPNRRELVSYTVVVLATIVVMTAFVASLDYAFLRSVVKIFG
jgi:preprotein translocase subunit SecE